MLIKYINFKKMRKYLREVELKQANRQKYRQNEIKDFSILLKNIKIHGTQTKIHFQLL